MSRKEYSANSFYCANNDKIIRGICYLPLDWKEKKLPLLSSAMALWVIWKTQRNTRNNSLRGAMFRMYLIFVAAVRNFRAKANLE